MLLALALGLAPAAGGAAEVPDFKRGGLTVAVEYGPGFWSLDQAALIKQVPAHAADVQAFVADLQDTHTVSLRLRYSVLGHVSLGLDLTGTGWNLADVTRGGAGFLTGSVAWHPLQLLFLLLKEDPRPLGLDLATSFGLGYGLAGQRRGADGLVLQWGFDAEYFFNKVVGLGLFVRGTFLDFSNLYLNFQRRAEAGNTVPLPDHSGGSFWTFGVALVFRTGE